MTATTVSTQALLEGVGTMLENIKSNVIAAIISAAIIGVTLGIWEAVSDGV